MESNCVSVWLGRMIYAYTYENEHCYANLDHTSSSRRPHMPQLLLDTVSTSEIMIRFQCLLHLHEFNKSNGFLERKIGGFADVKFESMDNTLFNEANQ